MLDRYGTEINVGATVLLNVEAMKSWLAAVAEREDIIPPMGDPCTYYKVNAIFVDTQTVHISCPTFIGIVPAYCVTVTDLSDNAMERGQGLIEYALVLLLIFIIVAVVSTLIIDMGKGAAPTLQQKVEQDIAEYEAWVDTCVSLETYDRETCELLGLRNDD